MGGCARIGSFLVFLSPLGTDATAGGPMGTALGGRTRPKEGEYDVDSVGMVPWPAEKADRVLAADRANPVIDQRR